MQLVVRLLLITSLDNEKIKDYVKLKEKKYRDRTGTFLVEGEHLVLEAYRAGLVDELILEMDSVFPIQIDKIVYVTNPILKKLSDVENPSYVMALCHKKEESSEYGNRVLMLDGVQDPGNLGTILRSSKAFDIDTVILSFDTVDLYNDKVIRASEGMIFHINVLRKNLELFLEELKQNYQILITDVMQGENIKKIKHTKNIALIIGNEGNGVKDNLKKYANNFVKINMDETCESLNASIAASILMYEIMESKNE